MKKIRKIIAWWLVLPFFSLLLFSCKSREKTLQKTETETENTTQSNYKIEDKNFEIVLDKTVLKQDFSYKNQTSETSKKEIKNSEKGKEYWENGNLKKEWERDLTELSETTKSVIEEITDKLIKETEDKKYFENSSNHYYSLWQHEIAKSKTKDLQVKSKPTYTWQMFFVGLFIGWLILPSVFRFLWAVVKRFQPYFKLLDWIKTLKK